MMKTDDDKTALLSREEKKNLFHLNDDPKSEEPMRTEIEWRNLFDAETLRQARKPETQEKVDADIRWGSADGYYYPDRDEFAEYGRPSRGSYRGDCYFIQIRKFPEHPGEKLDPSNISCTCRESRKGILCMHESAVLYKLEEEKGGLLVAEETSREAEKRIYQIRHAKKQAMLEAAQLSYGTAERPVLDLFQDRAVPKGLVLYDLRAALKDYVTDEFSIRMAEQALIEHRKEIFPSFDENVTREGKHILAGEVWMADDLTHTQFIAGTISLQGNQLTCQAADGYFDETRTVKPADGWLNINGLIIVSLLWDKIDELSSKIPDFTDANALGFFASLEKAENQEETEDTAAEDRRLETAELLPRIAMEDGSAKLTFKIRSGPGRSFVIRNLQELVWACHSEQPMALSKTESIDFGTYRFTKESLPLFDFIQRRVGDVENVNDQIENRNMFRNVRTLKVGSSLELTGAVLDNFYDAAKGLQAEYQDKTNQIKAADIPVGHHDIHISLTADPVQDARGTFAGVAVQGLIPVMLAGSGSHRYVLDSSGLSRVSGKELGMMKPFLAVADSSGYFRFQVGIDHLQEFYYRVVPALLQSSYVTFTDHASEQAEKMLPPEPRFDFWMDCTDLSEVADPSAALLSINVPIKALIGSGNANYLVTLIAKVSYEDHPDEEARTYTMSPEQNVPCTEYRDQVQEKRVSDVLKNLLPLTSDQGKQSAYAALMTEENLFRFLRRDLSRLERYGRLHGTDAFRRHTIRPVPQVKIGVSVHSSVMDLSMTSDLSEEELLGVWNSYRLKKRYHLLSSGDFIDLSDPGSLKEIDSLLAGLELKPEEVASSGASLPLYRALYVDHLLEAHEQIVSSRDRVYRALIRSFKAIDDAELEPPAELADTLRPYQSYGYKWIRTLENAGFAGILADEMGLGKTLQMISVLLEDYKEDSSRSPSLIVCPASLVYNWKEEFQKFAPDLKVTPIAGSTVVRKKAMAEKDTKVYIISYDLLKRSITEFSDKQFWYAVLDEAQYIKNTGAAVSKAVKTLKAEHRFALTGTPIENRLSELWSIFDFLMPGFLYDRKTFEQRFEIPIVRNEDKEASEKLKNMTAPFILRRKKADVLRDLPERLEEVRYVPISGEQEKLYSAEVVRLKNMIGQPDESGAKIRIFAELTRIREICCDPSLLFEDYHGESAKREALTELIQQAIDGGHRMLIFSQFTSMLALIEQDLKQAGIEYYILTGSTSKEKRIQLVHSFNEGRVPVFLISLKAGGTGLNLTGADTVIHYDPWWNLAAQNQATDRAHRIGQTKQVTVYRLITKGTIEEKILKLQEEKHDLAESVLSGDSKSLSELTSEELMELFR